MRRTLKSRLARLEKKSVSPKYEVLWVDVDRGETHEGVVKSRYRLSSITDDGEWCPKDGVSVGE